MGKGRRQGAGHRSLDRLALDSSGKGLHTADFSKLMRRILRATPTAAGPSGVLQSETWKTCKTCRKADQYTSRPALLCLFCLVCLV